MNELLIYGAPALTLGIGYLAAKLTTKPSEAAYWEAIAESKAAELKALRKKYLASTAANQELSNNNVGLLEALTTEKIRLDRNEKLATDNWNRFIDACKECNAIEEDYQEALASNRRLTDALQAKNERLERIVEAFADQKSGTAQKAVKIALGDA